MNEDERRQQNVHWHAAHKCSDLIIFIVINASVLKNMASITAKNRRPWCEFLIFDQLLFALFVILFVDSIHWPYNTSQLPRSGSCFCRYDQKRAYQGSGSFFCNLLLVNSNVVSDGIWIRVAFGGATPTAVLSRSEFHEMCRLAFQGLARELSIGKMRLVQLQQAQWPDRVQRVQRVQREFNVLSYCISRHNIIIYMYGRRSKCLFYKPWSWSSYVSHFITAFEQSKKTFHEKIRMNQKWIFNKMYYMYLILDEQNNNLSQCNSTIQNGCNINSINWFVYRYQAGCEKPTNAWDNEWEKTKQNSTSD